MEVATDNADMTAAKKQGHDTLPEFMAHLKSPASDEANFSIKFNLAPNDKAEYIWASNLEQGPTGLTGQLADVPSTAGHKMGDRVAISENDVIDWGYSKGSVMQGHATTKVLIAMMNPDEAAETKQALGWQ